MKFLTEPPKFTARPITESDHNPWNHKGLAIVLVDVNEIVKDTYHNLKENDCFWARIGDNVTGGG